MGRKNYLAFITILAVFFTVKLPILFLAIDKLIYGEECLRALVAKQLIDGPILPFFDLQWDSYSGGSLVAGLLMVPFFKLLGQNLISVKLVAFSFSLAALILFYLFCKKYFNEKVAVVTSLLFILSPPLFTKYSLITMGFHTESIFFSILLIFVFFEIFFNNKKSNFYFVLLGLIGGFGIWFAYISFITLFSCLLFWFLLDRGFFLRKNFLVFLISFTCGFSPWIYYNFTHSFSGIHIYGKVLIPLFSIDHLIVSLAKLKDFLLNDIRSSFLFEDVIPSGGKYFSTFYYLIFTLSFVVLFWLNRQPLYLLIRRFVPLKRFQITNTPIHKEIFFLIYLVIFFLLYSFSNFKVKPGTEFIGYRYLVSLYPFIFLLIALAFNKAHEMGMKGKIFTFSLPLIILLSIGLVSNLRFISFNKVGIKNYGIDYRRPHISLGQNIGEKYGDDIDKCISLINQLEERYRFHAYGGLGFVIGQRFGNNIDKCISLINQVNERYRIDGYKGILLSFTVKGDADNYLSLINQLEESYKLVLYRGLGFVISLRFGKDIDKFTSLINQVPERYRSNIYRGLPPALILRRYKGNIDKCIKLINQVEERYRSYFYRSLGTHFIKSGYRIDKFISLIDQVEERYKPYLYRGLGTHFIKDRHNLDKHISLINRVEERYKTYLYEGFGEGVATVTDWQFKGLVAHYINLIPGVEEKYKIAFHKGLGKGFYWQHILDYGVVRHKAILKREVEDKYISYAYAGLENPF